MELFPHETRYPEGFTYSENFITPAEEKLLCREIASLDLHPLMFQGYEAKRKVASFGYDYNFDRRTITKGRPIPEGFKPLIQKVARHINIAEDAVAELLVTEYPVGSVINWHRDAPPFDLIAGISLLSDCTFKLRPHAEEKRSRKTTVSLAVASRSLYVMQGASRSDWQHCITPVTTVRYSLTLRTLK